MATKIANTRAKANANYICKDCGSTEMIQAHHEIPGDDASLIVVCAECHSKRHPDLPHDLFTSKNHQPYWFNKSASSIARQIGVHARTIIRRAKKYGIPLGELSKENENIIKNPPRKILIKRTDNTTMQISKDTKDRLDKLGGKGDTYDDIVNRLLDEYERVFKNSNLKQS